MRAWEGNYLWVFTSWKQGGIQKAVNDALQYGFDGLIVKAHDGNPADDPPEFHAQVLGAVKSGHAQGLTIAGWGYLYGPKYGNSQVDTEANAVIETIGMGVDWYVIDAESEWEVSGGAQAVHRLMDRVRGRYPSFPIGYAPFWNTRWHSQYPYTAFSQYCNVVLPQDYYVLAKRQTSTEIESMWNITTTDFQPLGLPIAPVGQTVGGTITQIDAFKNTIGQSRPRSWWLWDGCPPDLLKAASTGFAAPVSRVDYEAVLARLQTAEDKLRRIQAILNEGSTTTGA